MPKMMAPAFTLVLLALCEPLIMHAIVQGGNRMADQEHLDVLKQGVETWNKWRKEHPDMHPNLVGADLSGADLRKADLSEAYFTKADLSGVDFCDARFHNDTIAGGFLTGTDFCDANLSRANLAGTDLTHVNLLGTNLSGANLTNACFSKEIIPNATLTGALLRDVDLSGADLSGKDLAGADLSGANLAGATLVRTSFAKATLTNCRIYGIAAWDVRLEGAIQNNLVITPEGEPIITVDNLKVAQFIYLLLKNAEIREVIETITSKVVLILGRFTPGRKAVLDALRNELRKRNYSPVLFDFAGSENRDVTETISLLARMARFVLADITDARSIPQELSVIVPDLPSVPVQPLLLASASEYGMFEHFSRYPWVLPIFRYADTPALLAALQEQVIDLAERMAREGTRR